MRSLRPVHRSAVARAACSLVLLGASFAGAGEGTWSGQSEVIPAFQRPLASSDSGIRGSASAFALGPHLGVQRSGRWLDVGHARHRGLCMRMRGGGDKVRPVLRTLLQGAFDDEEFMEWARQATHDDMQRRIDEGIEAHRLRAALGADPAQAGQVIHPGGNPGANRWFLLSTPTQMPPESDGICGRLT